MASELETFMWRGRYGWRLRDAEGRIVPPSPRAAEFMSAAQALKDAFIFAEQLRNTIRPTSAWPSFADGF